MLFRVPVEILPAIIATLSDTGHKLSSVEADRLRHILDQVGEYLTEQKIAHPVTGHQQVDAISLARLLLATMEDGTKAPEPRHPRIPVDLSEPRVVYEQPEPKPKQKQTLSHAEQGRATRSAIRRALAGGPQLTAALAKAVERTHSTTCHHLRRLEQAGEVTRSKQGLAAVWSLATDDEPVAPQEAPDEPLAPTPSTDTTPEPEAEKRPAEHRTTHDEPRGGGTQLW